MNSPDPSILPYQTKLFTRRLIFFLSSGTAKLPSSPIPSKVFLELYSDAFEMILSPYSVANYFGK